MRICIVTFVLLLVSSMPVSAQYYHPSAPRYVYPPHPATMHPNVPYAAPGSLFAAPAPHVLPSGATGMPTVARNYGALLNNLPSMMAYNRMARRSSSPYPYPMPGESSPQIHASSAVNRNDRSPLPEDAKSEAVSLKSAKEAFRDGKYFQAVGFANWAVMENPDDPLSHEFYSLAMFALGDYHGAALAAHAVLHSGQAVAWPTIAAWYDNPELYRQQLRALESHVKERPEDPAAPFLLGYHYLMLGHKAEAIEQLRAATKLLPDDLEAKKLLASLQRMPTAADSAPPVPLPQQGTAPYGSGA